MFASVQVLATLLLLLVFFVHGRSLLLVHLLEGSVVAAIVNQLLVLTTSS